MKRRRIGICISFALLSVFVVGLWIRSYCFADTITLNTGGRVVFSSKQGTFTVSSSSVHFSGVPTLEWNSTPMGSVMPEIGRRSWGLRLGSEAFIRFPYRLPIAVFVLGAIAPWIRYSLRTSLIVTAVIALLLGFALYL